MKLAWILILVVFMSVVKRNTAQNDNSSKTNNTLGARSIEINNKTNQTEGVGKKVTINNRKKFLVTRKPPIHIYRSQHRRLKKRPLITKIQSKRTISAHCSKHSKVFVKSHQFRKPRIAIKKYIDKTNINQYMKNFFQKTISNTDISVEDNTEELKENKAIVCTGPEIKSVVAQAGRIAIKERWFQNNNKLKDILKVRKCFLKLKKIENAVLSNKSKNKYVKLSEALQRKRNLFESNNVDSTARIDSSEQKLNIINELKRKFNESVTNNGIQTTTENIIYDARSKRSVNIIEEEGAPTTSSGFKFTGRDLSIHSGFIYKNIHN